MPAELDMLTYDQASELLHCSKKSLERAWQRGDLEAYRPGKRVLFKRGDLMRYLDGCQLRPRVARQRRKPTVICGRR
jgi:excisionase family DNA binding protein